MYLQINNVLINNTGDYKTLSISDVQKAVYDFDNNIAYIQYDLEYTPHEDIQEISLAEYETQKIRLTKPVITLESRVEEIETTLNALLLGGL